MPTLRLTECTQVDDLVRGLAFMGAGGGGRPEAARELLYGHLAQGRTPGWTDVAELPDDGWACCAFTMGSTAPRAPGFTEAAIPPSYGRVAPASALPRAIVELAAYTGRRVSVLFPLELGALCTTGPLHAALELGLTVVDGEGCGRAIPEAGQIIPGLQGESIWPSTICDDWGNVVILKRATSLELAEALAKAVTNVSKAPDPYVYCGTACYLMPVARMKRLLNTGSLSRALALGGVIRRAREQGQDPLEAALRCTGGWLLFRGVVTRCAWDSAQGYLIGETEIEGTGSYAGQHFRIWFKNENHLSWLNGQPFVTSPDLITTVQADTAEPITNTWLAAGQAVAVIGMAACPALRSAEGVAALGPRHFGFDLPYRPIEVVLQQGAEGA